MEKNIKISLETAREIYKTENVESFVQKWLLENFTKSELEGDEGYTWEKAFSGDGYFIENGGEILKCTSTINKTNKNIFRTEAQAKSALAFAQLSHIVDKYNEGRTKKNGFVYCVSNLGGELQIDVWKEYRPILYFNTKEDAEISLRVNRELWEQYHML